jgi:hypothetical protein
MLRNFLTTTRTSQEQDDPSLVFDGTEKEEVLPVVAAANDDYEREGSSN